MKDDTAAGAATAPASSVTGIRRVAFRGYRSLLLAFLLLGAVQIFLAGLGVFKLDGQELGGTGETAFDPHRNLGYGMGLLALFILILAVTARLGARPIALSAALLLLIGLAQSTLASLGEDTPFFGGLHAADGLLILGLALFLHGSARRR